MHKNMQLMLLRSLRKDQRAVGTNGKRGMAGEAVVCARCGDHVGARMPCEVFAVPLPIAVSSLGDAWWRPLTPTGVHMHRNTAVMVEGERGHGKGGQYGPTRCHEA